MSGALPLPVVGARRGGLPAGRAARIVQARARHASSIAALVDQYARQGIMLPRSLDSIVESLPGFVVALDGEGEVVGCGGLRHYETGAAEVIAFAVAPSRVGEGIGGRILDRVVARADRLRVERLFALTLRTELFEARGFVVVPRGLLPEKEAADCAHCPRALGCREIAVLREAGSRSAGTGPMRVC